MLHIKHKAYLFNLIVFFLSCAAVVCQPNRFQKFNSIQSIDEYKSSRSFVPTNDLELERFVKNLTYKNSSDYVYSVYPEAKYKKTILNGYGDCSTKSFGAAYYLLNNNIRFELIHFMPIDTLFKGGGHVTLRVPYSYKGESRVGILDVAGGGLPSYGGKYLDVFDLKQNIIDLYFVRLNHSAPEYYKSYYTHDYLKNVYLGFTPSSEVSRYFKFIRNHYVALGSEKIEKLVYDGLAILVGEYYSIYVDNDFVNKYYCEIIFYKSVLYYIRAFLLLFPLFLFVELFNIIFKQKIS